MMRSEPPARPGMAASQNNWLVVSLKPMAGSRTTSADTTNQTMNAISKFNVVIVSVRQASRLPVVFQKCSSSGAQDCSHVPERDGAETDSIFAVI